MVEKADVIRHEIEQTRDRLSDDLATLEGRIRGRVEAVKASARALSPVHHARQRPLLTAAAATFVGMALGAWMGRRYRMSPHVDNPVHPARSVRKRRAPFSFLWSGIRNELNDEIRHIARVAAGGLVRGLIRQSMPPHRTSD